MRRRAVLSALSAETGILLERLAALGAADFRRPTRCEP
ncbi:hypothetical protein HDA32_003763 [Spinactinospora alkalitolerans]|uniref:Uncharacterized protein n=1 Tax=Spinactinospora alkalitolerans TaxID=687207 RepID=A0A852U0X3_9ACTN|nr:hypothetical protein [Spinactinospora alkalitolerans]